MRYVDPRRWSLAIAAYAAGGAFAGVGWPQNLAVRAGMRPGIGAFAAINLLLPIVAVVIACAYPKMRTAVMGGLLLGGCFVLTRLLWLNWNPWTWSGGWILNNTHPIEVVATIGYVIIGVVVTTMVNSWRRVGYDHSIHCLKCGYALPGLEENRCPECGSALVPS